MHRLLCFLCTESIRGVEKESGVERSLDGVEMERGRKGYTDTDSSIKEFE